MKVLIFTTQLHQVGGYERLALELAEDLNGLGIHADILSMYSNSLAGVPEAMARLKDAGVPSVKCLGLKVRPSPLSVLIGAMRLRRLVRVRQYDVIDTSGFTPTLIGAIALRGTRTRQVAGIHLHYSSERHDSWRYRVWKRILGSAGSIVFYAVSKAVRHQWLHYSRTAPSRTEVVLNAVNQRYFDSAVDPVDIRSELGIDRAARIALFVGRLVRSKGLDTLIDAATPMLERQNLHLLIVGREDDSESVEDALMLKGMHSRLSEAAWGRRVRFLGERTDIQRIMAASDCLVHPARDEGFGLVLAEALAVGLPVIGSNVGGIPEVLEKTDSLLVTPDDPAALAHAIEMVLNWSPEERAAVIRKGRIRAEEFRSTRRASNMIDLYRRVLQRSGQETHAG